MNISAIRQTVCWFLLFFVLFAVVSHVVPKGEEKTTSSWTNPYQDVEEGSWSYQYITELNKKGVLPDSDMFNGSDVENRKDLVSYLYNMEQNLFPDQAKQHKPGKLALVFTDVEKSDECYPAIRWAVANGIAGGVSETEFAPEAALTRQQVCTILARFAELEGIKLMKVMEPEQFVDSLNIAGYARSGVTACQISGIVRGYEDGWFYPGNEITRQECAALVYRIMDASRAELIDYLDLVDLSAGAYDSLYDNYQDIPFNYYVGESPEVPLDYFADAVFIGDSVSVMLQSYCSASMALGNASFLCCGSMSATNILTGQIIPEYPIGSGQHPPIADSVAAIGAKKVYILLGINNLASGVERATNDMVTVITSIEEKNPDATIIIQSVTPMAESSNIKSAKLNNDTINQYNARMQELCIEHSWYYVNISEVLHDANGNLPKDYCSDYGKMGIHFTYPGCEVWVNYLKTHVPDKIK